MKKIFFIILSLSLLVYLIIVLTFAENKFEEIKCSEIAVSIEDGDATAFVWEDDIRSLLKKKFGDLTKRNLTSIDKDSIGNVLKSNSFVSDADVYYSLDGTLHIGIQQRVPVYRVCGERGFYVDEDGEQMPLSDRFTPRLPVVTGVVTKEFASGALLDFVKFITEDNLWNSMIGQIVVTSSSEILLIPEVGNFTIRLGKLEDYESKMKKLLFFLEKGINLKGWNVYKEINLKFENQVVCVRR